MFESSLRLSAEKGGRERDKDRVFCFVQGSMRRGKEKEGEKEIVLLRIDRFFDM